MLVLDLTLSDPVLLGGTAQPWHDAGYSVEYRRFYPHLTRADLARYHTLLFLLGSEPEEPSDAATPGDLTLLNEWVRRGGVVVLAYGTGTGSLDRWTANEWLASRSAGIVIDDRMLEDTTARPPWAMGRALGDDPLGSVYDSFPLAQSHPLRVARAAQALATTSGHVFVRTGKILEARSNAVVAAATRLGDGLVVVTSREALGVLAPAARTVTLTPLESGALAVTRDFLTALARWTRRPAEWAHVPPGGRTRDIALANAPLPLAPEPATTPVAPPAAVDTVQLPETFARKAVQVAALPAWIRQAGIRALWTPLITTRLDSIVPWLDQAGINLYGGDARPEIIADSTHHRWDDRDAVRRAWKQTTNLLQPTSVAWIPAFDLAGFRPATAWTDSSRGTRGESVATPCVFDSLYWEGGVAPAYLTLARLAGQTKPLIPALALDFVPARPGQPSAYSMGQEFCDRAWRVVLLRLGWRGALETVPVGDRYRTLLEAGLLPLYFKALEDILAARAQALRERALKEHTGLYFAFRLPHLAGDWFTLGLLRGFSMPDRPLLLLSPEFQTREALSAYRARGLNVVHAIELPLALVKPGTLPRLKAAAFTANDGFWLPGLRLRSDTVGRLLRRMAR
jgi:hypothetical protein